MARGIDYEVPTTYVLQEPYSPIKNTKKPR